MKIKKVYYLVFGLIVLVPLGLLSENPAWGEWDIDYYKQKLGFVPDGISNATLQKAPLSDYSVPYLGEVSGYYLSAIIGVVLIIGIFYILKKAIKR
jgi:hypothetical protein